MLEQMGIAAKQASYKLAQLSSREKNRVLEKIADELEAQSEIILQRALCSCRIRHERFIRSTKAGKFNILQR